MPTTRRRFLADSLKIAVLGGTLPSFLASAASAQTLPSLATSVDSDNVLVVIQMGGGNDGLNTIVPYSDDAYHRVRATIGIPETSVLRIDGRIGFNPVMAGMNELLKEGKLALVQGVGYPNPNRSHFEATQIWETACPDRPISTGWLGRTLDRMVPPPPAAAVGTVPSTPPTLFTAVSLGDTVPTALIAQHVDVPAVGALNAFNYNTGKDTSGKTAAGVLFDGAKPGQSPYLDMVEEMSRAALHGGDILRAKVAGYKTTVTYPADAFSQQMKVAAQIIGSRAGTRIVFVSIGSFDTHANQRAQQDRLLGYLSGGLVAFQKDLAEHGNEDRVLTMTFSEFGRRVQQNASNGTDHGTAMPLFIVGGKVRGGVYGDHPSLTNLDANGDLVFATDFRQVYATVLQKWLARDPSDILGGTYEDVAFV